MEIAPERSDYSSGIRALPWPDSEIDLVSRFEQCVQAFGALPALVTVQGPWTYDSLNRSANRLARRILALGSEEQRPIALLFDEAFHFLAASLAVLKAGRFYLPLDPSFPKERNTFILEDSTTRLLITSLSHVQAARELLQPGSQLLVIDDGEDNLLSDENLQLDLPPSSPAMLIYTSGSTGRPKGVLHDHRGLAHNARRQNDLMRITPADRCTMLYSTSVMGMTRDVYNALLQGASLHRFDLRQSGLKEMVSWIAENQITVLHTISSVFRHLRDILEDPADLQSVRLLILGGEEVLRFDVDLYRRFFPPGCQLFAGLGLSEAGTIRANLLSKDTVIESSVVPIGFPVRDVEILLLDEAGAPVPQGEIGEIAVRSAYIGVHYWHDPGGTSSSFAPASDGSGRRVLLTGDLARYLPDGALVHCGRKDFQVKMRGYRIELLEVEAAILETGQVGDAAAMIYEVGPGDKRLVAFVLPLAGQTLEPGQLHQQLSLKLPDYMVPSLFVQVNSLPRTPNGKIERNSLPRPDFSEHIRAEDAPSDDTQAALVELWKEVLSVARVGVNDSFFDLGGDSLLAGAFLARLEKQFGRLYPLSLLAEYDTVAKIARLLKDPNSGDIRSLVSVKPEGNRPPLFVVPGGYGDVLYLRHMARCLHPEQPLYGLQAGDFDSHGEYLPSIEEIATSFIAEMRKVRPEGPYIVAGHSFGGYVAIEIARQLRQSGQQVALVGLLDTYPPGRRRQATPVYRLSIHWKNLRKRDWPGRIEYLHQRWLYFLPRLLKYRRLTKWLRPNELGRENRFLVSRLARYSYLPSPYPGKVALIKATQRDPYVQWDPMETWPRFTPDLQTYEVQGSHAQIMFEPYVRQVAFHLEHAMGQALVGKDTQLPQKAVIPAGGR